MTADTARRIALGASAVKGGDGDREAAKGDPQTGLVDTLANLMHWAKANEENGGVDFDTALRMASDHFDAES